MTSHAYLLANLPVLAAVALALVWLRRSHLGRVAFWSGLGCLPCGLLALMHNGEYWSPVRLGGAPLGIEDFIFSFEAGAGAWLAAAWPLRRRLAGAASDGRVLLWGGAAGAASWGLWRAGAEVMISTLAGTLGLLVVLLARRFRLWPLALTGMAVFTPVYFAVVRIQFAFWPDYILAWNPAGPWAAPVWGIPLGEIVWGPAFAALWPVVVASALGMELHQPFPQQTQFGLGGRGRHDAR